MPFEFHHVSPELQSSEAPVAAALPEEDLKGLICRVQAGCPQAMHILYER
jgi:hypothetical protein